MNQVHIQYHKTKIGEFILGSFEDKLCMLDFKHRKMRTSIDHRIQHGLNAEYELKDDATLAKTRMQIDEYLDGRRTAFDIPLIIVGTDFQKVVWQALTTIPYGNTSTYLKLARSISNEKAVRAVAAANGANAISLIIPCHRIIGSDGDLVGYAGGISVKKRLLQLERRQLVLKLDF